MADVKYPKNVDGFIPKGSECEFADYCLRSGTRCGHTGENKKSKYHCGYCKAYRIIDIMRKQKGEKTLIPYT